MYSHINTTTVGVKKDDQDLRATVEMCKHCFDILIYHYVSTAGGSSKEPILDVSNSTSCPLFVTWDKKYHNPKKEEEYFNLRGCIGTLSPQNLTTSVGDYALTSALKDRRFGPIRLEEIQQLRVAVSLLVQYEECPNCFDWTVGIHGIIIEFHDGDTTRSATYLPEVASEQGWDQQEAVLSLMRKSGYDGTVTHDMLRGVKTTRYQSSKYRLTYDEYTQLINCDPVESALASSSSNSRSWMKSTFHR